MSARKQFEDAFHEHPIVRLLGMRLKSVTRKRVRAEMPITPSHMNRGGRVAGGIIMTFADVLGARGTVANLPAGTRTTTIESKTNFFAPGTGPVLLATATPLHIGRTTMVWQTVVRNPDRALVAVVTQTQIVLPAAAAKGNGATLPAADKSGQKRIEEMRTGPQNASRLRARGYKPRVGTNRVGRTRSATARGART
jgi:uncharacterized protein (TIGR00369 family)